MTTDPDKCPQCHGGRGWWTRTIDADGNQVWAECAACVPDDSPEAVQMRADLRKLHELTKDLFEMPAEAAR